MRKLLFISLVIIVGCTTTKPRQESITVTGYDFSKYTEEGFLITPEVYRGDYKSIGMITVTLWPRVTQSALHGEQGVSASSRWNIGQIDVSKAIDRFYEQASKMGADAITRFEVRNTSRRNGDIIVPGAEISGYAIDRTDN